MKIALVGNPNSGKTSIFNNLAHQNQKTGNFAGVTVSVKQTEISLSNEKVQLIDLPGLYSFFPYNAEEYITVEVLLNKDSNLFPDKIIYVTDITQLQKHLLLFTQVRDLGFPMLLVLNMEDRAAANNITYNWKELSVLLDVNIVVTNGQSGFGLDQIMLDQFKSAQKSRTLSFMDEEIKNVNSKLSESYRYNLLLHHLERNVCSEKEKLELVNFKKEIQFNSIRDQVREVTTRYAYIEDVLDRCRLNRGDAVYSITEKIDRYAAHPVWGTFIFLGIIFIAFQMLFFVAQYPMDWIDGGISSLSELLSEMLPAGLFNNFITKGLIPGIGGIVIFIPQIAFLFWIISLLEESGYMSRAVFLSDSILKKFGLNGKSLISLFSGIACSIPAIMAARTIKDKKERLITQLVTPFISCSARLPVYTILLAITLPNKYLLGVFNIRALALMGLYVLSIVITFLMALILNTLMSKSQSDDFYIVELPTYKVPRFLNSLAVIKEKVTIFVFDAGKIILVISLILWVLSTFGVESFKGDRVFEPVDIETSYLGEVGKVIEPLLRPMGLDWKLGIGILSSFAAREVFVSTVSTLYSIGSDSDEGIIDMFRNITHADSGELIFDTATSLSVIVFFLLSMQCMSTFAIVKKETNSWRWPIIQLTAMTLMAYSASCLVYYIFS